MAKKEVVEVLAHAMGFDATDNVLSDIRQIHADCGVTERNVNKKTRKHIHNALALTERRSLNPPERRYRARMRMIDKLHEVRDAEEKHEAIEEDSNEWEKVDWEESDLGKEKRKKKNRGRKKRVEKKPQGIHPWEIKHE